MLYRREGYPDDDEFVLVTITKIFHHSVFVNLDEYDKGGMVHISEIAPGRIRNLRDYVEVGKKIVCKVLRLDKEKGHIDLSLRRVNQAERKKKIEEIKSEQKAEKVMEQVGKELKIDFKKIYDEVTNKVFEHYTYVHGYFLDVAQGEKDILKLGLDEKLATSLKEKIEERFKPQKVKIAGKLTLKSYASDGVEVVKTAVNGVEKGGASVSYLGGGRFKVTVEAEDYKEAEKVLNDVIETAIKKMKKEEGECTFERDR